MSKYQEALDNLCKECEKNINSIPIQTKENETYDIHHCGHQMCPYRTISNDHCEAYETLNNLISQVDMLLDTNKQFEKENIKLEKALDRACSMLANYLDCSLCETCFALKNKFDCTNEKNWKEFLLKESEKQ